MLHPSAPLPRTSTATALRPRSHGRQLARNLVHLFTVLSLWLASVSPLLTTPQLALAAAPDPVSWRAPAHVLADASSVRAPYRSGMEPADPGELGAQATDGDVAALAAVAAVILMPTLAQAHPGLHADGLVAGALHPLTGLDHLPPRGDSHT